jgi:hypothetical protein
MRSGKPLPPFRRKHKRALSGARIAALALLFSLVAGIALYRLKPLPDPIHPIGAETIVTPEFDISDPENRLVLQQFVRDASFHGDWLGAACQPDAAMPAETYSLIRWRISPHFMAKTRIVVTLGTDGEAMLERNDSDDGAPIVRRHLDDVEANAFRALLLEGGYDRMPPAAPTDMGSSHAASLQSCIRGRYYGVARRGMDLPGQPSLNALAAKIEKFVDPAAPMIPYR